MIRCGACGEKYNDALYSACTCGHRMVHAGSGIGGHYKAVPAEWPKGPRRVCSSCGDAYCADDVCRRCARGAL